MLNRKKRRSKIFGTKPRPRVSVFRSNKHLYAQIINDVDGKTLVAVSDKKLKKSETTKKSKIEIAAHLGNDLAKKAKAKKIKKVVFDKSGYKYHGRVKALAEAMREGGLDF